MHVSHRDPATLQTLDFRQNQLKRRLSTARAGVGDEATIEIFTPVPQRQRNLNRRTIVLQRPLCSGHQTDLQISSTRS